MKSAAKITLIYAAFASLWIVFSDRLMTALTDDPRKIAAYSSIKGLLFVTITGLILYYQIHREIQVRNRAIAELDKEVRLKEELIRELHHRIKNNMQVALGLLNIETRNGDFTEKAKERISNKLISMMSVFNIVYDHKDMRNLSMSKVMEEYARIGSRNIEIGEMNPAITCTVEVAVSSLLAVDSILEMIMGDRPELAAVVSARERGRIDLRFPGATIDENSLATEDRAFVDLQLRTLDGYIAIDGERGVVTVRYSASAQV